GELVKNERQIFFKFHPEIIESGLNISPIKMNLGATPKESPLKPFGGLFGVFADSLPDSWGRLLLDRKIRSIGGNPLNMSLLNRLAFVGKNGIGALTYKPIIQLEGKSISSIDLDEILQQNNQLLAGNESEIIDELYRLGGSSGGARPKAHIGYNHNSRLIIPDQLNLPSGYEHWIVKFPSRYDLPDIANIEFAYYKMAIACGLEMSTSKLIESNSGKSFFATKRFDREGEGRFHVHSVAGLLHDDFERSSLDYGHILDLAFRLERNILAQAKVFRLMVFNVLTHNRDDHSKNFSFLMNEFGQWSFSPVYDLTFSSSSHGEHSTTINGKGKNIERLDLLMLAEEFKLKMAKRIIEEVASFVTDWSKYAIESGVSNSSKILINKEIQKQLQLIA
ncbi:MAG: type II toxin-antitoxin system HipA family toxin, partial [Bacteroidetes bacterium]|nr:type II toxin-antitoxin system HipA family toxin [Bacteroidota bacterium]